MNKRSTIRVTYRTIQRDAGFSTHVALEKLSMGEHQIWIMHEDVESGEQVYQATNKVIKRTPNTLLLEKIKGN